MIFLVFINGNVWAGYESERAAREAAADVGGIVQSVHFVRGRK